MKRKIRLIFKRSEGHEESLKHIYQTTIVEVDIEPPWEDTDVSFWGLHGGEWLSEAANDPKDGE